MTTNPNGSVESFITVGPSNAEGRVTCYRCGLLPASEARDRE